MKKRKTWLWVLGWIFIFPLPLTLILYKKESMDKKVRYGIIAGAWVLYLAIVFLVPREDDRSSVSRTKSYSYSSLSATEQTTQKDTIAPLPTEKSTQITTERPTETSTEKPTEPPTEPPTEAPAQIEFYEYTDTVEAGSFAYVIIHAEPNTEYSIHVYYDSGESKASGLEPKTSDSDGYIRWNWKVGSNTAPGEYTIKVSGGKVSESVKFTVYQ